MDYYQFLLLAVVLIGVGYFLGRYDRKHPAQHITTPDNPADIINNLKGQVAQLNGQIQAQRMVMQTWVDTACDLGFDGVLPALESISRHRGVMIRVIASAKGGPDAHGQVISLLQRGKAGGKP